MKAIGLLLLVTVSLAQAGPSQVMVNEHQALRLEQLDFGHLAVRIVDPTSDRILFHKSLLGTIRDFEVVDVDNDGERDVVLFASCGSSPSLSIIRCGPALIPREIFARVLGHGDYRLRAYELWTFYGEAGSYHAEFRRWRGGKVVAKRKFRRVDVEALEAGDLVAHSSPEGFPSLRLISSVNPKGQLTGIHDGPVWLLESSQDDV
ncbi:MAG: hypothetical protein AB7S38_06315 [Vulcanimicrobiota bacterium]